MQDFLAREPAAVGVRFGIKRTGCSGFGYTVDLAEAIAENDQVFQQDGLQLVVDRKALPFVDGTEIDFERNGLNATFVFRNPNATGACGCGESFTVDATG
jgi:iron-sulfur cluster assembly protein